jgi:hypothetical protein
MTLHENPENDYERMLERLDLDCSQAGCWNPIAAYVRIGGDEFGFCREHVGPATTVTRWLEQ